MPPEKELRVVSFATHATRGLIRAPAARRKLMIAALLGALGLLILGSTVLREMLDHREHAVRFILFWGVCAWLTALALLLAFFDVLITRAQARAARKELAKQFTSAPRESGEGGPA